MTAMTAMPASSPRHAPTESSRGAGAGTHADVSDGLLGELGSIERQIAALTARSVTVLERLARLRREEYLGSWAADMPSRERTLGISETDAGVVDEICLATGLRRYDVQGRLKLAVGEQERCRPVREALGRGELSWERARKVVEKAVLLEAPLVGELVSRLVGPYPARAVDGVGGLAVPHDVFTSRLSRFIAQHVDVTERHRERMRHRTTRVDIYPDGEASLSVTGHVIRVACAHERVETIARRLRREGDSRTLANLRSDIALDLLQWGKLPSENDSLVETYATFSGVLPPARVDVTISAAALMGATDEPGIVPIAGRQEWITAGILRDVAFAAGSTWRRLVTDPVTGHLLDLGTTRYAVTGELRQRIVARDLVSRVPGSTRPAAACDADHDIDHALGGTTDECNVSAKDRRGHNHKTRHTWRTYREPTPNGSITWTTPSGRQYVTTPWDYRDPDPPDPDILLETLTAQGARHSAATSASTKDIAPVRERLIERLQVCPTCRTETIIDTVHADDLGDRPITLRMPAPAAGNWQRLPDGRWGRTDPGPPPF